MKLRGHMQETDTPLATMAKADLERILPFSQVSRHASGDKVCAFSQLADLAFLVLRGKCQEILIAADQPARVLKTFAPGEAIANGVLDASEADDISIVAAEDSTVLRIRHEDLAGLVAGFEAETNGSRSNKLSVSANGRQATDAPKSRLLTLASLSANPQDEPIATALAHALHDETGESVALVCLTLTTSRGKAVNSSCPPDVLLGQPAWQRDLFKNGNGFNLVHIGVPAESIREGAIEELTEVLRRRFPYVLVTCAVGDLPAAALTEFITRSDKGYLLVRRTSHDQQRLELLVNQLRIRLNGHAPGQINTILCLADGETVGDFDEQLERAGIPVHTYLHGAGERLHKDIRRLARDISGRLVGLALASGGAKGFAHIGVLQVLEENDIEVDLVAGSSMGAYVGSIWAHGATGPEMEKLAREMEGRWAIWRLLDPAFPPRRGFLRGVAVKHRLMRTIGESRFGDLVRPLRVVATNLETLDRVIFNTGAVADAVHASIAVPGICVPVVVGDDTFADGGIVDPLPVDVLREAGVRRILAVNTIPTPERIRYAREVQRTRVREHRQRRRENSGKIMPFDQHLNYFARGNILEILMRSFLGVQTHMAESAGLGANVVLCPEICDDRWVDFRNPDKYIRAGRNIALKHLDEIKALVRQTEVSHAVESNKSLAAVG